MWKSEHRVAADRRGLGYSSDMSAAEWSLIALMIPLSKWGGRKGTVDMPEVLNAIFYVLATGCQWKALPKDLPPKITAYSTTYSYFMLWDWSRMLEGIHDALYVATRAAAEKDASLTAEIDRQSGKMAQKGARRLIRRALTRERKLQGANAMSLSMRSGSCSA